MECQIEIRKRDEINTFESFFDLDQSRRWDHFLFLENILAI